MTTFHGLGLRIIREQKAEAISTPGPAGAMQALADIEQYAPLVAYIVRSFQAGGGLGESLFEHMVEDTTQYLELGVAAGTVRPSRNPAARERRTLVLAVGGCEVDEGRDVPQQARRQDKVVPAAGPTP